MWCVGKARERGCCRRGYTATACPLRVRGGWLLPATRSNAASVPQRGSIGCVACSPINEVDHVNESQCSCGITSASGQLPFLSNAGLPPAFHGCPVRRKMYLEIRRLSCRIHAPRQRRRHGRIAGKREPGFSQRLFQRSRQALAQGRGHGSCAAHAATQPAIQPPDIQHAIPLQARRCLPCIVEYGRCIL